MRNQSKGKFSVLIVEGTQEILKGSEDFGNEDRSSFIVLESPGSVMMKGENKEVRDMCEDENVYGWTEGKVEIYAPTPGRYIIGKFVDSVSTEFICMKIILIDVDSDGNTMSCHTNCSTCSHVYGCPDDKNSGMTACARYSTTIPRNM